ncbi:unnamed protein product [Coregonus sp. 'balchen']|nr:unnamed protein product [Coregonus sp. 'balchen']
MGMNWVCHAEEAQQEHRWHALRKQLFSGLVGVGVPSGSGVPSANFQAAGLVLRTPPDVFIQMTASSREERGPHHTEEFSYYTIFLAQYFSSCFEERSVVVALWMIMLLSGNRVYLYYTFSAEELYNSPTSTALTSLIWAVGITDFVLKYFTISLKCFTLFLPKILRAFKSIVRACVSVFYINEGFHLTSVDEYQPYAGPWQFSAVLRVMVRASSQQCSEAGDVCAICQGDFRNPIALLCHHVFCEECLYLENLHCWKDGTTSAHFQI